MDGEVIQCECTDLTVYTVPTRCPSRQLTLGDVIPHMIDYGSIIQITGRYCNIQYLVVDSAELQYLGLQDPAWPGLDWSLHQPQ
jgi:hypothetical protein